MEEHQHRLILLYARLHDALIAAIEDERLHNPLCSIPDSVALPEWHGIKNAITKPLSIWNIAVMRYPYRDVWSTDNPQSQNFANKRRWLVYDLLDAVYRDEIKIYQYPAEIDNQAMFKRADISHQAKAEIHVNSLRAAIVDDCFYWGHFKVVKLWDTLAIACQSPSLPFQDPPTPLRLRNTFTSTAFFRPSPDDVLTMQATTENLPEDISLEFMDSWEIWRQQHAWKRNPIQGKAREIIHRHLGIIQHIDSDNTDYPQAIHPQKPATRLQLQVQALHRIRATMPAKSTKGEIFEKCKEQEKTLFGVIARSRFNQIWIEAQKGY